MLNTAYERERRVLQPDISRVEGHIGIAFFFGCPDVKGMYDHLTSKGITVADPFITGYGWHAINLKDPDGYGIWFHWPVKD